MFYSLEPLQFRPHVPCNRVYYTPLCLVDCRPSDNLPAIHQVDQRQPNPTSGSYHPTNGILRGLTPAQKL